MNHQIMAGGEMTGTEVLTVYLDLHNKTRLSIQGVWTGDPEGTFVFKGSNHPRAVQGGSSSPLVSPEATWSTLDVPDEWSAKDPAGDDGDALWEFGDLGCAFLLIEYTNTGGDGSLDLFENAKT